MYFLFNRTTFQIFVTNLTGALYVHPFVILQGYSKLLWGFNNLSYKIHLRYEYMYFFIQ